MRKFLSFVFHNFSGACLMTGSSLDRHLTLINLRYTGRNQIQAAMPLMPAQTNRTSSSAVRILPAVSPVFFLIFTPPAESLQAKSCKGSAPFFLSFLRFLSFPAEHQKCHSSRREYQNIKRNCRNIAGLRG